MNVEEAAKLLRKTVKQSHLGNQKHIDLTLVDASERNKYQKALMYLKNLVQIGEMTDDELRDLLGLK